MTYQPAFPIAYQHPRGIEGTAAAQQEQQDNRATDTIQHSMASGSVDATEAQMRSAAVHEIISCTAAGRILTIPAGDGTMQGPLFIASDAANTQSCTIQKGTTLYAIAPGEHRAFWNEATTNGLIEIAGAGSGAIVLPTSKRKTFSGCHAYHNTTQNATAEDWYKLTYNSEYFDDGGWHDTGVNPQRLTVPAGVYKVRLAFFVRTNATGQTAMNFHGAITKNGGPIGEIAMASQSYFSLFYNGLIIATEELDVVPGDYFESWIHFYHSAAASLHAGPVTGFSIWAVSEVPYGAVAAHEIVSRYFSGTPAASQVVHGELIGGALTLLANFAGAKAHCGTNPSATTAFAVKLNGVSIGSISFNTSGVATFTTTSAIPIDLVAGDYLEIVAPGALNGIASLAFTLRAYHA